MDTFLSLRPLFALVVSAVAALLIIYARHNPNLRESFSLGAGVLKFLIVVSMAPVVLAGGVIDVTLVTLLPGVSVRLRADALGLLFATTASCLWILATIYSIGYMRSLNEHAQTRFYTCFALALSATMGVAFAGNLFTLFLFYEILSLSTYPLVMHKETKESWEGGKMYVIYLVGASKSFFLAAMILTYMLTGTLEFQRGGMFTGVEASSLLLTIIYILFIAGLAKAALMPFHSWLPAAMVAPTPVSALLHAVAVVKVGVFSIVRVILDVFGVDLMQQLYLGIGTAIVASITLLWASTYALAQDNLKIRLAYSTVSQLSYVILGMALLTPAAMAGGMIHVANHAFSKITLFFCAGAIYVAAHKTLVSELSGLAKKMPYTMAAFTIGSLSMIGVPLFAGFVSKWNIALGAIEAQQLIFVGVLLLSTVLNASYFVPIVYKAYFETAPATNENDHIQEAPAAMVVPIMITAAGTIALGIYPDYFMALITLTLG
ncbi:MAG TPA: monovalent cation/H+ antiporter subunit D family protein [Nitrospirales bacterium]|nr:monovalent cation/H+ antiporter subunit D family protein [Nitrospirales bacterium]